MGGIGIFERNPQKGALKALELSTAAHTSNYTTVDREKGILYSATLDALHALKIDRNTGKLTLINKTALSGTGGSFISLSHDKKFLLVSHFATGSVVSRRLNRDGSIGEIVSKIDHEGSSVNPDRQEGPHAHMALQAPDSQLVFVPDLGIDKVMIYQISDSGVLTPGPIPFINMQPGDGPRHVVFHPNNRFVYVLAELSNFVEAYEFDPQKGPTKKIARIKTIPSDFNEFSKSAAIRISQDGNFLYSSNRGHNSIATFKINQTTGELSLVDILPTQGEYPRDFSLDPTGDYILIGNRHSGTISIQNIDSKTGTFEPVDLLEAYDSPVCITFVKRSTG